MLMANRAVGQAQAMVQKTVARLSSGLRINQASDDAAGLAIASRMEARGRAINVGLRGINDLVSLVQVADSTLASIGQNLQRIRELAVQAANGIYTSADRQALNRESQTLYMASREMQSQAAFNGQKLLDGSLHLRGDSLRLDAAIALDVQAVFSAKTTDVLFRYAQMAQASTSITPTGALSAGDLRINGKAVSASVAGAGAGQTADSAWAIAKAIQAVGITDLTATASTTVVGSATAIGNGNVIAGQIVINGVPTGAGNYVSAINGIAGLTGVTASVSGGATPTLTLRAADGRNISVSGVGGFGLSDQVAVGSVTVTGPLAEGAAANLTIAGTSPGNAGFNVASVVAVDTGDPVYVPLDEAFGYDQNPNLETADGATSTILIADRKLAKLLDIRSKLGAVQNTLELRSALLANAGEANAAARSRVIDADYAVEMVALIRGKIIQQAGLAMIAQSNLDTGRLLTILIRAV
jgi:flagellin